MVTAPTCGRAVGANADRSGRGEWRVVTVEATWSVGFVTIVVTGFAPRCAAVGRAASAVATVVTRHSSTRRGSRRGVSPPLALLGVDVGGGGPLGVGVGVLVGVGVGVEVGVAGGWGLPRLSLAAGARSAATLKV